jgi:hypothetical protein
LSSWHKSTKESILSSKSSTSRIILLYGNFHSIEEQETVILIIVSCSNTRSFSSITLRPSRPRYQYFTIIIINLCLFMSDISMEHGCNNPSRTRTSTIIFYTPEKGFQTLSSRRTHSSSTSKCCHSSGTSTCISSSINKFMVCSVISTFISSITSSTDGYEIRRNKTSSVTVSRSSSSSILESTSHHYIEGLSTS